MTSADLLIEIGTEELPPAALRDLAHTLADEVTARVDEAGLARGELKVFASPRRLGFRLAGLQTRQEDRQVERTGPALDQAFDDDGNPTKAAEGFARSLGLRVDQLEHRDSDKGKRLGATITEEGKSAAELIPDMVSRAVQKLPIPKRMRWGKHREQFVRPVHWLVALQGEEVLDMSLLGQTSGRTTHGHRFHGAGAIQLASSGEYENRLENEGFVMADFDRRRALIRERVAALGRQQGGEARMEDDLLEEVTALVEWPVPQAGRFDEDFLRVPQEALITAMQEHQKYFPVLSADGKLLPAFIFVSNIESARPEQVVHGNEKVIRPRLADAAFFYDNDRNQSLEEHSRPLKHLVFQHKLGTVADKCERVSQLAARIAEQIGGDAKKAKEAGRLSKADLTTETVDEFDTMQGILGYYLARNEDRDEEFARALYEQYLPRFAGDGIPATKTGQAVAVADKLDTVVGIFGIGQKPTGDKDPFALRRASLGILRTLIERELDLDLVALIDASIATLGDRLENDNVASDVSDFFMGRYQTMYRDQGVSTRVIRSVLAVTPNRPMDFDRRVRAVRDFLERPEAEALASAHKRVGNILAKQPDEVAERVDENRLEQGEEKALFQALQKARKDVEPQLAQGHYGQALNGLAALRDPVDALFDEVLVMAEDPALRANRLALLRDLRELFLTVADIGELQA
jgi:glycyl-tRNA synthetase beta chain